MFRKVLVNRFGVAAALALAIALLFGGGYSFGYKVGRAKPTHITVQGVTNVEADKPAPVDFGTFWQSWQMVSDSYLKNDKISTQEKVYGAIRGLIGSLDDPYSQFFPPADNEKFQEDARGDFGGIGAEIGIRKEQLVIVAPLKDTPASRIGLQASDRILRINATSTEGMSVDQAVRFIRGPKGTEVKLLILREAWDEPKEMKIVRDTIVVPTLDFDMKGDIAYVQLHSFNAQSERLFYGAAVRMLSAGAKGMVLDLRNNPGGYLDVAVRMAGWFVPRGTLVVSEVYRTGEKDEYRTNGNAALVNFPVVVIINEGSASASEILAGTLRDLRNAKLVGDRSFGKGTVQQLLSLRDGSSLKLTVAHWVLPSGKVLEENGLEPDVEVAMTDEDREEKRDLQLDKALEILKSGMQ